MQHAQKNDLVSLVIVVIALLVLGLWNSSQPEAADKATVSLPPGHAAMLSLGGRLYDNHWTLVKAKIPSGRHPLYSADAQVPDTMTWRCVSCHGWEYVGGDGHLGQKKSSVRFVSLVSVIGRKPERTEQYLKYSNHQKLVAPLSKNDLKALAHFLSFGQHDLNSIVDRDGKSKGDPRKGKDIYEGTCSRCHQADGKAPLYSVDGGYSSLGWLARHRPARTVHKIRNGVTSADMLSLRFVSLEGIGDLVAYLQTLDPE